MDSCLKMLKMENEKLKKDNKSLTKYYGQKKVGGTFIPKVYQYVLATL